MAPPKNRNTATSTANEDKRSGSNSHTRDKNNGIAGGGECRKDSVVIGWKKGAMETTLYDDDTIATSGAGIIMSSQDSINSMKRSMKLDLGSPSTVRLCAKKQKFNSLLSSPDLNMLKLGSPELERMIIAQNNGLVTTTPTPTQYMFPRPVTEEQEVYARGFTEALAELQTLPEVSVPFHLLHSHNNSFSSHSHLEQLKYLNLNQTCHV